MSYVYELIDAGPTPVTLAEMKGYLRISGTAEDAFIQTLLNSATAWSEGYTGREFRVNTWQLLIDFFTDPICIRRNPIDTIDSITYLVGGAPITIDPSIYYLKLLPLSSEILLNDGEEWPSNGDPREQGITITFKGKAYKRKIDEMRVAIMRFVAFLYENRGDCLCDGDSAMEAGITPILDQFRISRI